MIQDVAIEYIHPSRPFKEHTADYSYIDIPSLFVWRYIGFTFKVVDQPRLTFWSEGIPHHSQLTKTQLVGRNHLHTNYPILLGVRYNWSQSYDLYFDGDIACLQIYDRALTEVQVKKAKTACDGYQ